MGSAILYYLLLKPLSFLPLWVLYRLSDVLYLLIFFIFPYRKKVVRKNLRNSFPDKSTKELKSLERKFYRHFCDVIVESVKVFSIAEKEVIKRCRFTNSEIVQDYFEKGQSLIAVASHYANWELAALASNLQVDFQCVAIYAPLKNKFFNKKLKASRGRLGLQLLAKKELPEYMEGQFDWPIGLIFAADQSPPRHAKTIHWTTFLNQPTAFFLGAERYAKQMNWPVLFFYVRKIKRGYYEFTGTFVEEQVLESQEGAITEGHVRMLEALIMENPEYWLWTHNRWKRPPPVQTKTE